MNNVMVDIETLGIRPTSIFLSLAAVQFDLETGKTGRIFTSNISLESAVRAGRTFDASTLKWWMEQDDKARKAMFNSPNGLEDVLVEFSEFLHHIPYPKLWGNSALFDLGIVGDAYDKVNVPRPWSYQNECCYRTVVKLFPDITIPSNKNIHHPLADCMWQIERLCKVWKIIGAELVDKERFLTAVGLLREIQLNSSPAVAGLREKVNKFFGTPTNDKGYQFENPSHSFTEGMELPVKESKAKDEENE